MSKDALNPRRAGFIPAGPLWQLAPTVDADGRNLADFMMLIPGLSSRDGIGREAVAGRVREVCETYGDQVAFADINLNLNLLWVSVAAKPGLAARVAASLRQQIPEALMVGGVPADSSGHLTLHSAVWRQRLRGLGGRARRLLRLPG